MARLILDAGVLVAADRDDRRARTVKALAVADGIELIVPAAVLAQAWRGSRNANLARFLKGCLIHPLDEPQARRTGELCAAVGIDDVVDASIVAASRPGDTVITTDVHDLERLGASAPDVRVRAL